MLVGRILVPSKLELQFPTTLLPPHTNKTCSALPTRIFDLCSEQLARIAIAHFLRLHQPSTTPISSGPSKSTSTASIAHDSPGTQSWQEFITMSPSSKDNGHTSSNFYGENVRHMNVLASAYCVDSSARLTGFHYSTTGAGGTFYPFPFVRDSHPRLTMV